MGIFGSIKDNFSSAAAEKFIADYIKKYGKLTNFKIDSGKKSIDLSILLTGEVSQVDLKIGKYALISENNKDFIVLNSISASRDWLNQVLNDFLKDKKLEIPGQYAGIIKKVL